MQMGTAPCRAPSEAGSHSNCFFEGSPYCLYLGFGSKVSTSPEDCRYVLMFFTGHAIRDLDLALSLG